MQARNGWVRSHPQDEGCHVGHKESGDPRVSAQRNSEICYPCPRSVFPPLHQAQHGLMLSPHRLSFVSSEAVGPTLSSNT